jgi:hypothetical protein
MNIETETAVAAASQKAAYAGAGAGLVGWLNSDIIFGVLGLLVAAVGTAVTVWCKLDARKREQAQAAIDNERKRELHSMRKAYFQRAIDTGEMDLMEGQLLGIDSSDFAPMEASSAGSRGGDADA